VLITLTKQLAGGKSLTDEQVVHAVVELTGEAETVESKADFLTALAQKGETTEEISAFAHALRDMAVPPPLDKVTRSQVILDVCGTGGDRLNTFNISTTVALVMAAAGVKVAKHGNRAVTSQAGSADVLEALGIRIDLTPAQTAASLRDLDFAFLFASNFHPAFKQIAPARQLCGQRKQRTIFNFLGPLLNPAQPDVQLMGVPRQELCEPIAKVLQSLGVRHGMVVCGSVGDGRFLDEISILGPTFYSEFSPAGTGSGTLDLEPFQLQPATLADLAGADRHANAEIVHRILRGEDRGPKRDAVLVNCAAAMVVAGKSRSCMEGWKMAAEVIDSGRASKKLEELAASQAGTI